MKGKALPNAADICILLVLSTHIYQGSIEFEMTILDGKQKNQTIVSKKVTRHVPSENMVINLNVLKDLMRT